MRARQCLVLAFAIESVLGCSEPGIDEKFGGSSWESEHYRYRYREGDPLACPEVLEQLESYGDVLRTTLGVAPGAWSRTTYYKYPDAVSFQKDQPCRSSARACTTSSELFSVVPLDGHELTHNVMAKQTGTDVSLLLAEGLANALTCTPRALVSEASWSLQDFGARPSESQVVQAGRLVLTLLSHLSPQELMQALQALPSSSSPEDARQRILADFGVDLADVQAEAEDRGVGACVPLFACGGPALSSGSRTLRAGCNGFDRVTLPEANFGPLSLTVTGTPMRFMPCELGQGTSPLSRLSPYRAQGSWRYWLEAPSARHALWFDAAETTEFEREAQVSLEQLRGGFQAACSVEQQEALRLGDQVALVLDGASGVMHFSLDFGQASKLVLDWQKGPEAETFRVPTSPMLVSWCEGCADGAATGCTPLDRLNVEAQIIDTGVGGVLRVEPSAPLTKAAVLELAVRAP